MSKTVLQVLPRLVTGGVERGTIEIATALTAAGWTAIVASQGGPMVEQLTRIGATHVELPLASKNPLTILANITRLCKVIEQYNVDIVHARSRAPAWSAYYAARRTRRHFVTTFHNAYGANSKLKRMYNSVMGRGQRVIAISNFVGEYAVETYGVKREILRVIPRGVDLERFDPMEVGSVRIEELRREWGVKEGQRVVILPGRLTRWKGHEIFINAIANLPQRDALFLLVGSGDEDYKLELRLMIEKLGLEQNIRLVGECHDMPAAFRLADIVVSASSRPEGFGRVIVEAQAMGTPVIATDHGGARETLLDNETGWLIPPGRTTALANALERALKLSPDECQRMGEKAIAHMRGNFTTERMAKATLAVYDEVLRLP